MSLKAFHIFFILVSVATTAGFGMWALKTGPEYRIWGIVSLVATVGLIVYGVAFLNKIKRDHL